MAEHLITDPNLDDGYLNSLVLKEGSLSVGCSTLDGTKDLVLHVFGPGADPSRPWFVDVMERIRRERWTFLSIASSCGCDVRALAKGPLEIRRIG